MSLLYILVCTSISDFLPHFFLRRPRSKWEYIRVALQQCPCSYFLYLMIFFAEPVLIVVVDTNTRKYQHFEIQLCIPETFFRSTTDQSLFREGGKSKLTTHNRAHMHECGQGAMQLALATCIWRIFQNLFEEQVHGSELHRRRRRRRRQHACG